MVITALIYIILALIAVYYVSVVLHLLSDGKVFNVYIGEFTIGKAIRPFYFWQNKYLK